MTRTPYILGPEYDTPAKLPDGVNQYLPKRQRALTELDRAEAAGEADVAQLMFWELGLIDLILAPADGVSAYGGSDYEPYASHFHLTDHTAAYALERAAETQDVILKLHYLEYALLRMPAKGRDWIERQRELSAAYREYVNGCRLAAPHEEAEFVDLHIERALVAVGRLLRRSGVLRDTGPSDWAAWLVSLADESRSFPEKDPQRHEQQRHRWVADYLVHLADLPNTAAEPELRLRALTLLDEATLYYQATPLNDNFERRVAEVEANLRKHWGESGTHERLVRRHVDAIVRRAEFHKSTGNGILTAHFFREARQLVERDRQYFTAEDVTHLQLAEQAALEQAVNAGEFAEIHVPMVIPNEMMDYTRDTPEATMDALLKQIVGSVPNRVQLAHDVEQTNAEAPVHGLMNRTVLGSGKVVGESQGPEANRSLDVEQRATLIGRLLGAAVTTTIINAADAVSLTADHLVAPIVPMHLDEGTMELIRRACERFLEKDFISALHILIPRIEDALRQHLKLLGVDTTEFRRDVGDGTSRTDDASLGTLMRRSLPDSRSINEYLGNDLWDHLDSTLNSQTGPNLRNEFAHGLARPSRCSPENAGLALSLLYLLADAAQHGRNGNETEDV